MKSETKGSVAAARKSMRQTCGVEMVDRLTPCGTSTRVFELLNAVNEDVTVSTARGDSLLEDYAAKLLAKKA